MELAVYRSSIWSTRLDLVVTDPTVIVQAMRLLDSVLERVDVVANRFRHDSEINDLHRRATAKRPVAVSADLCEALGVALRAALLTDGAVDPTVGMALCRLGYDGDFSTMGADLPGFLPEPCPVPGWRSVAIDTEASTVVLAPGTLLDLGATAKAWAADRAAHAISDQLGCGTLVSIGGDIAIGGPAPEGGFAVGIADICGDPAAPATVAIRTGGLATSGTGRRHWVVGGQPVHHLIDPATGLPTDSPWKTVSVTAGSCVDANTASTAAMVIGGSAPRWLTDRGLPARLVSQKGDVVTAAGWPEDAAAGRPGAMGTPSQPSFGRAP